jgi:hypothetical protein
VIPRGRHVDHEDGNTLHNAARNLQVLTHKQNSLKRDAQYERDRIEFG